MNRRKVIKTVLVDKMAEYYGFLAIETYSDLGFHLTFIIFDEFSTIAKQEF